MEYECDLDHRPIEISDWIFGHVGRRRLGMSDSGFWSVGGED